MIETIAISFTGYGFIVLMSVLLMRVGKACLDQRERLFSKRHALRQGRLFVHLRGGNVTVNDLDRAFNWNYEQLNAFTGMSAEASAPLGALLSKILEGNQEIAKAFAAAAIEKGGKPAPPSNATTQIESASR